MTDPTFTAAPSVIPSRSAPSTFSALTDPFLVWEKTFRGELSTSVSWFALQVTNAGQAVIDAQAEVVLAADQVTLATAQKDEATAQAVLAASSAAAAIVTTNAAAWVSEASYTALDNAISGVDFGTYRAILTHTGETTDPSADETNWVLIGFIGKASQAQAEAGTDNSNGMTPLRTSQAIDELSPRLSTVATTGATQSIDFGSNKVITSAANAATVTYSFDNPVGVAKVDLVIDYQALTGYSVASAFYENVSFSIGSQEVNPNALFFKPDGTKMYVMGSANKTVYQYSLSTAWVVSSASYDSVSFSVSSEESRPDALFFKSDGSKMYVLGLTTDTVHQYFSADIPTLVFPGTMESVTIPLNVYEKTAVTIVTADSGASYQVISILGGIV